MTIARAIESVLLLASLLAIVPAAVLLAELMAAWLARGRTPAAGAASAERTAPLAVLMPAHDEAAGIAPAIRAVIAQLGARDRLLVVADNCSDATAAVAREAGAEVVERRNEQQRGKGYALDFGVRELERDPPAVLVIVDADCIVGPQAIETLARRCLASARPIQALYLMQAPAGAALGLRVAQFAWLVKNKLRPLGAAALGWPCQLMGTGMAFPWRLIQGAPLASGHLVEDMQLGLDLAAAGSPPMFCAEALVSSMFPTDAAALKSQRTRWEHGHLSVIASVGPRLLRHAVARREPALLGMTLDLMVPPLAALVLGLLALLLIDGVWWAFGGGAAPFLVAVLALGFVAGAVMSGWISDGRRIVTLAELLKMPLYVAAKIPVYISLFTKRQVEWVRTKRDD